jgi:hypothetical protein
MLSSLKHAISALPLPLAVARPLKILNAQRRRRIAPAEVTQLKMSRPQKSVAENFPAISVLGNGSVKSARMWPSMANSFRGYFTGTRGGSERARQ